MYFYLMCFFQKTMRCVYVIINRYNEKIAKHRIPNLVDTWFVIYLN